jgi:hypothetical protein
MGKLSVVFIKIATTVIITIVIVILLVSLSFSRTISSSLPGNPQVLIHLNDFGG